MVCGLAAGGSWTRTFGSGRERFARERPNVRIQLPPDERPTLPLQSMIASQLRTSRDGMPEE